MFSQRHPSSLLHSPPGKTVLDLGRIRRGANLNNVRDFTQNIGALCTLSRADPHNADAGLILPPPTTVARFHSAAASARFRSERARKELVPHVDRLGHAMRATGDRTISNLHQPSPTLPPPPRIRSLV